MDSITKKQAGASDHLPAARATTSTGSSGSRRVAPYLQLRTLLLRYLSSILVDTVLNQAMFKRQLSQHAMTVHDLRELAPDIMLGLRLFVPGQKLPELMLELAELLEDERS